MPGLPAAPAPGRNAARLRVRSHALHALRRGAAGGAAAPRADPRDDRTPRRRATRRPAPLRKHHRPAAAERPAPHPRSASGLESRLVRPVESRITISAPRDEVFAFVADMANRVAW